MGKADVLTVSSGPYGPESPARVKVVFGHGGCLVLPDSSYREALKAADAWAMALHREACGGCVVILV